MWVAMAAVALAAGLAACGGGGRQVYPGEQPNLNGVYSGLATSSVTGAEITITVQLQRFGENLEAALRYPQDPEVEAVFGVGSQWGRSFAIVMSKGSGREFYLEGFVSADGSSLTATIRYPDRAETLAVWALLV